MKVADGYARNYLLPRKLALPVTEATSSRSSASAKFAEAREAEEQHGAEALAQRLAQTSRSSIARRVGENDALYGSVTSADIAEALAAKGFEIDQAEDPAAPSRSRRSASTRAGQAAPRRHRAAEGEVVAEGR